MQFFVKLAITLGIITICSQIGGKFPKLAGLIATMPLTGLLVLVWLYHDNPSSLGSLCDYTQGALWGIGPSVLFFVAAYTYFNKKLSIWVVLSVSFAVWLLWAVTHQWLLHR